jgi:two-component SAPR family response regulator
MADDLSGLRVLVVEDDFLIAMDIKGAIERLGGHVIGPIGRLEQAQDLARREVFDAAILDVKLDGEVTFPLAEELLTRGVPIVLATGYDVASLPENFQRVPHLRKPFHDTDLRRLAGMFSRQPKS